jgi:hypothetical protein
MFNANLDDTFYSKPAKLQTNYPRTIHQKNIYSLRATLYIASDPLILDLRYI